ncbi:disease resistance protein RRS1-like [Chenopodium quinoa]|uniref:disease resistance protein RRS1-like n=1 Tax=Chenopodium quinoa TaxID=63459 RepID=UPI000B79592E|nr:disease resistance protein RRS1-like [Chenopodium quinoa]
MVVMGEGEINDSWSLLAVVKESSRKAKLRAAQVAADDNNLMTTITTTTTTPALDYIELDHNDSQKSIFYYDQYVLMNNSRGFLLPSAAGAVVAAPVADEVSALEDELKKLCRPFLVPQPPVVSSVKAEPEAGAGQMSSNLFVEQTSRQHLNPRRFHIIPNQSTSTVVCGGRPCNYKKKKFEDRRMVRLTMEELSSSDKWEWRKYGQKPIKGSPYPRNYYRCSSVKGCSARKQVERSPIDPNFYIVTYTNRHHHPCPSIHNTARPRVRIAARSEPTPPPGLEESPTNTVLESGYGPGLVGNEVIEIEHVAGDDSFSSGEMNEVSYNYNDHDILTMPMNSMTYSDLLSGMDEVNKGGNCTGSTNTTNNYYSYYNENNVGYNPGCDPNVKMGVRMEVNGSGHGVGIREMYAPAPATLAGAHQPPSNMGQNSHNNIWDNGMIRP